MNLHDEVPIIIFHVLEADIPQDAGVVEEDIDTTEGIDGGLNNAFAILDTVIVGYGLAASILNFADY
jgi:hypothetical protein